MQEIRKLDEGSDLQEYEVYVTPVTGYPKGDTRVYMMKDSRITLEVLQGERTKLSKMGAARDEVVPVRRYSDSNAFMILRKCNPDARQIGAYERIDMQPYVTYMEQPGRVIDRKGTSAYEKGYQTSQSLVVEPQCGKLT
ncbi:hypothetical protein AgCh_016551 [Apium graveolens]